MVGCLGKNVLAPFPFVFGRTFTGEHSQGRVNRAAQMSGPDRLTDINSLFETIQTGCTNFSRFGNRVGITRADGYSGSFQADFVQLFSQFREFVHIHFKNGKLNAIVSVTFYLLQQAVMRFVNIGGPQQHIHAVFHGGIPCDIQK
jgi:hypothetical protein